jgi:hypothetical protein
MRARTSIATLAIEIHGCKLLRDFTCAIVDLLSCVTRSEPEHQPMYPIGNSRRHMYLVECLRATPRTTYWRSRPSPICYRGNRNLIGRNCRRGQSNGALRLPAQSSRFLRQIRRWKGEAEPFTLFNGRRVDNRSRAHRPGSVANPTTYIASANTPHNTRRHRYACHKTAGQKILLLVDIASHPHRVSSQSARQLAARSRPLVRS